METLFYIFAIVLVLKFWYWNINRGFFNMIKRVCGREGFILIDEIALCSYIKKRMKKEGYYAIYNGDQFVIRKAE